MKAARLFTSFTLAMLFAVGFSFADEVLPAGPQAAPLGSPSADPKPQETEQLSGKLVMTGHESLVALINGEERIFKVSPKAEIRKDGNIVLLAALSRHDRLNLSARRAGADMLIDRIEAESAY